MYMKTRNISIHKLKRQPRQGIDLKLPNPAIFEITATKLIQEGATFINTINAMTVGIDDYYKSVYAQQATSLDMIIDTNNKITDSFRTTTTNMGGHMSLFKDQFATVADAQTALNTSFGDSRAMSYYEDRVESLNTNLLNSIKNNTFLERRNSGLNKSFGVTSRGAAGLAEKFLDYANAINGTTEAIVDGKKYTTGLANQYAISSLEIGKYAASLQTLIPLLDQANPKNIAGSSEYLEGLYKGQSILQTSLGLTQEQALQFEEMATFSDKSALTQLAAIDAYAKGFDPKGTAGVYKGIIQEIAGLTSNISIHYAKQPLQLAKSVMKMKQLGLSMQELYDTGEQLLDIESSIENELSYQLITGNQLIGNEHASVELQGQSLTNAFREAHLSGKSEDAAEAMNQILEQEAGTLKNNLFARKEMAKLLNISEQQLASSLAKKEILDAAAKAGVTIDLNGTAQSIKAAEDLLKAGTISAEQFETLVDSQDQRTTEDIAKSSLTALQELVVLTATKMGTGQVGKVDVARAGSLDAATDTDKYMSAQLMNYQRDMNDKYVQLQLIEEKKQIMEQKMPKLSEKLVQTVPQTSIQDAIIPPGNGSRILSFPEDKLQPSIAFNDQDTITASTQAPTYASTMPPTLESDTSNPMLLIADVLNKLLSKSPTTTTTTATADSGQHIMQVGKMIVAALQNQTGQLKPKPIDNTYGAGLNKPHFSGKI